MSANVKNAASGKQVGKAVAKAKEERRQELKDIQAVMSAPQGRRLMWRIINQMCHVDTLSKEHSGSETYFNEGERNIGRLLKSDVYAASFDEYQKMERECVIQRIDEELLEEGGMKHE